MKRVVFKVPGKIRGKGRPRTARLRNGKGVVTYTPDTTVEYESLIQCNYIDKGKGNYIKGEPFVCSIDCYFKIPKTYKKGERDLCLRNIKKPTKKPDVDNIAKIVLDALNGYAFNDDSQCVRLYVGKEWSTGEEYIEITLSVNK